MRTKEIATTLLFLRHGATDYPENRYYCDTIEDPPLNETGLRQASVWPVILTHAAHAAHAVSHPVSHPGGKPIAAIYVSPSRRTRETAEPLIKALGSPNETLDGLRERSFGAWGGLTAEEVQKKYPSEWSDWKRDFLNFIPSEGESLIGLSKRVDETIQLLLSRHAGQTLLVVTHVGPIRTIVAAALGAPLDNIKRLVIGHGSMTQIEYTSSWPNLIFFSLRPELFYKENP